MGIAAHNFNNLGVKAIAKRAAKDTGKAVMEDYKNTKQTRELTENQPNMNGSVAGAAGNQPSGSSRTVERERQPPERPKTKPLPTKK